ncbi:MAG: endonuclease/exonuclease/phosphatase family protein [Verrucomicrobia bacterium]|nr:endonuclease/exonuclease/phosphatase family protein [Verrucomicrobiota bacterium]
MRLLRRGIEQLDPDLMSFQEAGYDGVRHQIAEMLSGLGYHVVHQLDDHDTKLPGIIGNALASRWPLKIVEVLSLQLTPRANLPLYAAVAARVDVPEPAGPMLLVGATTSWELHCELERELQAVAIAKMIQRLADPKGFPTIIGGDLDAAPDSASIRFLTGKQSLAGMSVHYLDAWEQAGDGSLGHTWTHENGLARKIIAEVIRQPRHARRIDYILLGSPHNYRKFAQVRTCRVVMDKPADGLWPSDHYAVYAEIDVEPADAQPKRP